MIPIIYLDMDGVCCDFVKAVEKLYGADLYGTWPDGAWDVCEVLGISHKDFWKDVERAGETFWSRMEPYPHYPELHYQLAEIGQVTYCTTPANMPCCYSGKKKWLNSQLGVGTFRDIMIKDKWMLAAPGRVLVDDNPKKVKQFVEHGGQAVMVERLWNSSETFERTPPEKIVQQVKRMLE